ncbi:HU family DNA-binding protein [Alienimonas californiensis]|uniref:DNA-binding protein HRL53 n=1 Tax=Alienimonas californiensis TaxID=2527989 RepID=A0A517PDM4_9PLAN|nr:HU family DNA-binding protein [Alienimonas californiensis]QDT17488.1 DNA-binding protein HRL53 [Alienimonas californiensis]
MAKKAAKKAPAKKAAAPAKPMTKAEVLSAMAERTGLQKTEVQSFFTELEGLLGQELGKKGPGSFNVPGLMKVVVQRKDATPETTKKNPFKPGEMMTVSAKPARNVVKIRPLKGLKDLV